MPELSSSFRLGVLLICSAFLIGMFIRANGLFEGSSVLDNVRVSAESVDRDVSTSKEEESEYRKESKKGEARRHGLESQDRDQDINRDEKTSKRVETDEKETREGDTQFEAGKSKSAISDRITSVIEILIPPTDIGLSLTFKDSDEEVGEIDAEKDEELRVQEEF
ncbi:hypothetical protein BH10ACI2_BH10ACI2_02760 [soil metagenome]